MLNRLSSVLQSAADALAPPPPPLEDLKYHWKLVMRFYAQRSIQSKCPIEDTNIPAHLEQLLRILISEETSSKTVENEGPCTTAGPCLEFLLQHRLLELLVSLARADSPPGMRRYLLGYLQRLVSAISPHLLTLASIHLPILSIINLCCQSKASPTEKEEIEFLLTLCQIVHRHPYLSIIFNKETRTKKQSSRGSSESSNKQNQGDAEHASMVVSSNMKAESTELEPPADQPETTSTAPDEINCNASSLQGDKIKELAECSHFQTDNDDSAFEIEDRNFENKATNDYLASEKNEPICNRKTDIDNTVEESISDKENDQDIVNVDSSHKGLLLRSLKENEKRDEKTLKECLMENTSRTTSGSCTPELFLSEDCLDLESGAEGRLPLLDAVLGYINSADSETKLHVCEALLLLVSMADKVFSSAIARTSHLGLAMAEKLISSFQEIPPHTDPDNLEDIPQNWGPKTSQLWLEQHAFPGSRLIASFVSWLNFCDQLAVESSLEVSESVAGAIRALFFEIELESELRTGSSMRQHLITNIICICLRHITSNILLTELNTWLMGEADDYATLDEQISLKQILLNNCLHSDNHLSLNSMRLFELLLENCDDHVLDNLVLKYLTSRAYCDASSFSDKSCMDSWSDEEDARERDEAKNNLCSNAGETFSRTFAPHNIHKIIDSFLQLLPSSLRSASDYQESGYHQYIAEAQRQYTLNVEICTPMGWGTEATFPSATADAPSSSNIFNEGPFLNMLFVRLRGLAHQPYEVNLQLTALVSRLAMLPHPHLHEFLLNPLLPFVPGTTTLYSTMQDVARELQSALASLPNSKRLLAQTRRELLGDTSFHNDFAGETRSMCESVVVLEEFCKELAAIAYVKYHHAS